MACSLGMPKQLVWPGLFRPAQVGACPARGRSRLLSPWAHQPVPGRSVAQRALTVSRGVGGGVHAAVGTPLAIEEAIHASNSEGGPHAADRLLETVLPANPTSWREPRGSAYRARQIGRRGLPAQRAPGPHAIW